MRRSDSQDTVKAISNVFECFHERTVNDGKYVKVHVGADSSNNHEVVGFKARSLMAETRRFGVRFDSNGWQRSNPPVDSHSHGPLCGSGRSDLVMSWMWCTDIMVRSDLVMPWMWCTGYMVRSGGAPYVAGKVEL